MGRKIRTAVSFVAVRQVAAATIADLAEFYVGTTHSSTDVDNEWIDADFTVDTINRSNFTGTFADGILEFSIRGTVSRTGRITFNGTYSVPKEGTKLTIKGSGQLSAGGNFFVGTATELGKWENARFKDSLTFWFVNDDFIPEELGAAGKAKGKGQK